MAAQPATTDTPGGTHAGQESVTVVAARWKSVYDPVGLVAIADTIFDAVSSVYVNDRPSLQTTDP
jgi:hypothetical protein